MNKFKQKVMKKFLCNKIMLCVLAFIPIIASIQIASGQAGNKPATPMPENLNKIFQTSCTPCHWAGGKKMAMSMINFSKWVNYDAEKEAKKASMICYVLNKGKMPPKGARKAAPGLIPTKEQIDLICKWAESLKK
jgi:hypothetical protein